MTTKPVSRKKLPQLAQRLERRFARMLLGLPDPLLRRLAGPPVMRDGLRLDVQAQFLIGLRKRSGKKAWHERSVAQARRDLEIDAGTIAPVATKPLDVQALSLASAAGTLGARIYRPLGLAAPSPALLFVHGGGFALGSLDSHDGPCRWLAAAIPCVVISVDYRRSPEQPFPAGVEDCIAAFRAVVADAAVLGIDARRIAVGGDSAGGNLAAVVAQQVNADPVRPCFQLLFYPTVDMTSSFASIRTLGEGFFLENASIQWCKQHYLGGRDDRDPRASPLYGRLEGLPPALVQTAGFDPLRDEGEAYAEALRKAGVTVESKRYDGLIHGYINMAGALRAAQPAMEDAAASLRGAFFS
jgi:acetyl esterase